MAKNITRYLHNWPAFPVACTHPSAPDSGDPVRLGLKTGIALTDEGDGGNAATETTVFFGACVVEVLVDDNVGSGIAVGDPIYYHDTGTGSPTTSLNNSAASADAFFGIALATVSAAATTVIAVYHTESSVDITVSA